MLLVAPHAPANACDMETGSQQTQHQGHDGPPAADPDLDASHDCCDTSSATMQDDCSRLQYCGASSASGLLESGLVNTVPGWKSPYRPDRFSGSLPPSHSHPPYRPPAA